jgi:hypothetical protein
MLINPSLAGKKVATEFGTITFNDKGESKDLSAEQEKKLANLRGFSTGKEVKAQDDKQAKAEAEMKKEAEAKAKAEAKAEKEEAEDEKEAKIEEAKAEAKEKTQKANTRTRKAANPSSTKKK